LKWNLKQRMGFIEAELFGRGRINRGNISQEFGISGVQATLDLSLYAEHAPGNMIYDRNEKSYLISQGFTPQFITMDEDHLLGGLALKPENQTAVRLPTPHRNIDPQILQTVLQAVNNNTSVAITYQSMSYPTPRTRTIAPHIFCHNGMRWHVRGFCFLTNTFRDFLLARILAAEPTVPPTPSPDPDADLHWKTMITLVIEPHPGLSADQREVIELDYGMEGGMVEFKVRQAALFYTLRSLGLLEESSNPAAKQIRLKNHQEVLSRMNEQNPGAIPFL